MLITFIKVSFRDGFDWLHHQKLDPDSRGTNFQVFQILKVLLYKTQFEIVNKL